MLHQAIGTGSISFFGGEKDEGFKVEEEFPERSGRVQVWMDGGWRLVVLVCGMFSAGAFEDPGCECVEQLVVEELG